MVTPIIGTPISPLAPELTGALEGLIAIEVIVERDAMDFYPTISTCNRFGKRANQIDRSLANPKWGTTEAKSMYEAKLIACISLELKFAKDSVVKADRFVRTTLSWCEKMRELSPHREALLANPSHLIGRVSNRAIMILKSKDLEAKIQKELETRQEQLAELQQRVITVSEDLVAAIEDFPSAYAARLARG